MDHDSSMLPQTNLWIKLTMVHKNWLLLNRLGYVLAVNLWGKTTSEKKKGSFMQFLLQVLTDEASG